jgi:hypothetical protein
VRQQTSRASVCQGCTAASDRHSPLLLRHTWVYTAGATAHPHHPYVTASRELTLTAQAAAHTGGCLPSPVAAAKSCRQQAPQLLTHQAAANTGHHPSKGAAEAHHDNKCRITHKHVPQRSGLLTCNRPRVGHAKPAQRSAHVRALRQAGDMPMHPITLLLTPPAVDAGVAATLTQPQLAAAVPSVA